MTQGLVQLGFTLMDAFGPKIFGTFYSLNKNKLFIIKDESILVCALDWCVSIVCAQIHKELKESIGLLVAVKIIFLCVR